jgi:hypothetical protein
MSKGHAATPWDKAEKSTTPRSQCQLWAASQVVPEVESPRANLTGYHTTKEQVLKRFRLLVAERTCMPRAEAIHDVLTGA